MKLIKISSSSFLEKYFMSMSYITITTFSSNKSILKKINLMGTKGMSENPVKKVLYDKVRN